MTIEQQTINTIRMLAADMVQKANSGHPGAPMGMAPLAYALWLGKLKHDANNPLWNNRDRVVLSNGHASALLYSMLHLCKYDVTMDDLKQFRQWGSKTPGHPDYNPRIGIESTTGPLGQGIANAVGMAIAETMLAAKFNRTGFNVVDHRTYAICGDGCMMEGISSEACSLAGTLRLSKLTVLYDDNGISIEGETDLAFGENVGARFEAYGWQVVRVEDGNDYAQVVEGIAKTFGDERPSLVICPTVIGYGSVAKQGKASAHGEPLGADEIALVKKAFGLSDKLFQVSQEIYQHTADIMKDKSKDHEAWQTLFSSYAQQYPELAEEWQQWHDTDAHKDALIGDEKLWQHEASAATRATSGAMINRLAAIFPNLVGGSADLAPSNKTIIKDAGHYSAENCAGRNLHFGVREHAMGAICNGIAEHGGLKVYCSTFLVFIDYMRAAIRMSSIIKMPVVYVFTHDSIGVGEDGETHQPIEHLAGLRAMPGLQVIRPADGRETTAAWIAATTASRPTCLALTRQNLPELDGTGAKALKGGYTLNHAENPDIILMASGSEVQCIVDAAEKLSEVGIQAKVVSMPSMELFLEQPKEYQDTVLNPNVRKRLAIEAGATMPWRRFVGLDGTVIGLDHFGASAPAKILFEEYGITADNVIKEARKLMGR